METVAGVSSMLETSRDLTLDAVQAAAARTFGGRGERNTELSVSQIKKLLDSRFDQEILDGLRKVISMQYRGQPCLPFFSTIIKQVASPNIEIKKLVYIYLLHHAEQEQDLALLSINTIQKALSDQSPQVRAMALRVMSGIRVPLISQIVSLAIKKGAGDMSALVRKTAAAAIPKCYRLEPTTEPQLVDYIALLLGDKQYYVVGAAVVAFIEVCPDRIDLIHKHYRSLVKKLVDMDEWGQIALIRLLTVYARKCFPRSTGKSLSKPKGEDEDRNEPKTATGDIVLDDDLVLFLNACKILLQNRNPAVILAVTRAYVYVGSRSYLEAAIKHLIGLLRGPSDQHAVVLHNIVSICLDHPDLFAAHLDRFWPRSIDSQEIWQLKLEILNLIFPSCDENGKGFILNELEHFTTTSNPEIMRQAVRAMGKCAQNDRSRANWCINLLLKQTSSEDDTVVGEALTVVRHLIQQDPSGHRGTIMRLAKNLDSIHNAQARATIVWLIGEYATVGAEHETIAPDVLRILCRGFAQEDEIAKSQILLLGAKVYLNYLNNVAPTDQAIADEKSEADTGLSQSNEQIETEKEESKKGLDPEHIIPRLWDHILLLVRYDTSFELRDRARLYRNLLADATTVQLASLILLAPKPVPQVTSPSEGRKNMLLGSASLVIGHDAGPSGLAGYEILPEWVTAGEEPDPSLRATDSIPEKGTGRAPAAAMLDAAVSETMPVNENKPKVAQKSLDDWLDEEDESAKVAPMRTAREESSEAETDGSESAEADEDSDDDDEDEDEDDDDSGESSE